MRTTPRRDWMNPAACSVPAMTVTVWRRRYREEGLAGLRTRPRGGRPRTITPAKERAIVAATMRRPKTATHWSARRLAKTVGVSAATVQVAKDGKPQGLMSSEKRQHVDSFRRPTFEPSNEVGIRSNLQEDVYITYAGSVGGTEEAVYRFTINPLVWWVWFGGFVLAFGGLVTMWPGGGAVIAAARRAPVRPRLAEAGVTAE